MPKSIAASRESVTTSIDSELKDSNTTKIFLIF